MKKRCLAAVGHIHAALILALVSPVLYVLFDMKEPAYESGMYFICLLIFIPITITDICVTKCKNMFSFLFICIAVTAASTALAWLLGPVRCRDDRLGVMVAVILAEAVIVMISRIRKRISKRTADEMDPESLRAAADEPVEVEFLDDATMPKLLIIVSAYAVGVLFDSGWLCNIAFFSGIVYFVIVIAKEFLSNSDWYIYINREIEGLPVRQMTAVSLGLISRAAFALLLLIIITALLIPARRYTDITKWSSDKVPEDITWETPPPVFEGGHADEIQLPELIAQDNTPEKQLPQWVNALFKALAAAVFISIFAVILNEIRKVFIRFGETYGENGDIVERLDGLDSKRENIPKSERANSKEGISIRKKYKRYIKKHLKDLPRLSDTPTELEKRAGVQDEEEMVKLHALYERARYGKM